MNSSDSQNCVEKEIEEQICQKNENNLNNQKSIQEISSKEKVNKKKSKRLIIIILILILLLILSSPFIITECLKFRDKKKVINYLYDKYDIPKKDLTIVKIDKTYNIITLGLETFDSGTYYATYEVKYKKYVITVDECIVNSGYSDNPDGFSNNTAPGTLTDNYESVKYYQDNVEKLKNKLFKITQKYSDNSFIIIDNYKKCNSQLFKYDVFVEKATINMLKNLDLEVKQAIKDVSKEKDFSYYYAIYIFNSIEDYNKIKKANFSIYETDSNCCDSCLLPYEKFLPDNLNRRAISRNYIVDINKLKQYLENNNNLIFYTYFQSDNYKEYKVQNTKWYLIEYV